MGNGLGSLYGVGVGPGDPELLTLKAVKVLQRVPVLCVPKRGLTADSYARTIVEDIVRSRRCEVLELVFPMTRDAKRLQEARMEAGQQVASRLLKGLDCAFITEGDPMIYSTFVHLMRAVKACLPEAKVEVVPGISSINAAAARVLWSLGDADDRIAILPATYEDRLLRKTLEEFDTVVLLKVNNAMGRLLPLLDELSLLDRAVYVSRVTSGQEEVVWDLRSLGARRLDYLSLVIISRGGSTDGT